MKKLACILIAAVMALSLAACGSSPSSSTSTAAPASGGTDSAAGGAYHSDVTIEYAVNFQIDDQVTVMQELIDEFKEQTGITVELTLNGTDHESMMKTRMASGDLPDLWNTHGWSVMRYGEFLMPLNDQPWYQYVDDSVKGSVEDDNGNIYILPICEGANGILYNEDVLKDNGIDAGALANMSDFEAAMEKLVQAGITPMYLSNGGNQTNNGHLMDAWLPAFLTNASLETNYGSQLLDGTFDWNDARPAFDRMADWWQKGYFNKDASTADRSTCFRALATGECAFMFYTNDGINACRDIDPECNISMLPMPSVVDGGLTTWGISEGNNSCIGIWKDTKHPEECKKFLEFLASPEVAKRVAEEIEGGIPALANLQVDGYSVQAIRAGQKLYEGKVEYGCYFDQAYLPSGMFWVLMDSCSAFFEGQGGTEQNIQNAIELMQTNYTEMYSAS